MRRIIDISLGIGPDLLTWPGDPGVEVRRTALLERGDEASVSELRLGSYTRTHVDPPFPFHQRRAGTVIVEGLDLSAAEPGAYSLVVLPLKIVGSDAAALIVS